MFVHSNQTVPNTCTVCRCNNLWFIPHCIIWIKSVMLEFTSESFDTICSIPIVFLQSNRRKEDTVRGDALVSLSLSFLFLNWFFFPVKKQLISHLSSARMSNPHTWCPGYIPFEHKLFQVKLINLFITWAVSLPNHRVRNESTNRTASGAFVWESQVFFLKLLCKCIFDWICEAKKGWIMGLPQKFPLKEIEVCYHFSAQF